MKRQFYWKLCIAVLIACIVGSAASMFVYHGYYDQLLTAEAFILGLTVAILLAVIAFLVSLPFLKKFADNINETENIDENYLYYNESFQKKEPPYNEEASSRLTGNDAIYQLSELYQERNTINEIIDNMAQGLVLIAESGKILAVNRSAAKFLSAEDKDYTDDNIISLVKDQLLLTSIEKSMNGHSLNGRVDLLKFNCQYYLNPVFNEEKVVGATLFLLDDPDTDNKSSNETI